MTGIKGLYDSSGKIRFIGSGAYSALVPLMSCIKPGFNIADTVALHLQRWSRGASLGALPPFHPDWLQRYFPAPVKSALFTDTSHAKDMTYIGLVETTPAHLHGASHIDTVKIFPTPDDVIFAAHQARFVREHLSGPFVILSVTSQRDNFLVSRFIPKKRSVEKSDYVEEKLLHLADIFAQNTSIYKDVHDLIPLDFHALCIGAGYVDISALVRQWLATGMDQAQLPVIPVHGDVTPWHVFINHDEKIVLTDYERAGWHVPYYDYYHYVLQAMAIRPQAPKLASVAFRTNHDKARDFLRLYLIDQLYQDLGSVVYKKHDHKKLHFQIANKVKWLKEILPV